MRIVILTDIHANLPALNAALDAIEHHSYHLLVHLGDAIGIGPFPAECLDRLLALPRTLLLMGNHDAWFVDGLPKPQPPWMSNGEVEHQRWTHAQIDSSLRTVIAAWPYVVTDQIEDVPLTFLHYPLTQAGDFLDIMPQPTIDDLDVAFANYSGDIVFYGHHHPFSDLKGHARYINPGSLGCAMTAEARYTMIELEKGEGTVSHCKIPYDDTPLFRAFEERRVPERAFLYHAFFGGRFHV